MRRSIRIILAAAAAAALITILAVLLWPYYLYRGSEDVIDKHDENSYTLIEYTIFE